MKARKARVARWAVFGLLVAALSVVAAGCGGGDDDGGDAGASTAIEGLGTSLEEIQENAREEGEVNLVHWPGYAVLSDEFTAATGCTVNTKDGAGSEDMISLMKTGAYDGVSASGNASVPMMIGGDVAPVDTDLVPNYADVQEGLKDQVYNSLDGQAYGVPHGRGPNYLMFNTEEVPEDTDSWSVVWEDAELEKYKGKISIYGALGLHRRRCGVPEGHPARPRHRQSVSAEPGAVRRRGRPAEEAGPERRRVLAG